MRCKKHYTDLSSTIGVCSCCLRERLLYLIAAQEHAQTLETLKTQNSDSSPTISRSFSLYIANRKSDFSAQRPNINHVNLRHHHSHSDQLFYTTPAVAPAPVPATSNVDNRNKKRRFIRFISLHNFFRSRNRTVVDSVSATDGGGNAMSSSSKSSWFTTYIYGGKHRRKNTVCVDESIISAGCAMRRRYCRDRGMSPAINSDGGDETEDDLHNLSIGYESTIESWKNTPRRTPANNTASGRGAWHVRNLSGLTFCISPMVLRPSPNRKGRDCVGDIRVPVKPHLSNTKSFCANRSRKLADFGRPNQTH